VGVRRLERSIRWSADNWEVPALVRLTNGCAAPFDGPSRNRIVDLLGLPLSVLEAVNLLANEEATAMPPTRLLLARTVHLRRSRRVILLCGKDVARAFGLNEEPFLRWRVSGKAAAMVIPHPSGRWWNDDENLRKARRVLRSIGRRLAEIYRGR
jgi:hypothetical protein